MGVAIARAIDSLRQHDVISVVLANRSQSRLDAAVTAEWNATPVLTTDIPKAVNGADIIILAVKPYAVAETVEMISGNIAQGAMVISVAAGIPEDSLRRMLPPHTGAIVCAIPDTAIACGHGITFITSESATEAQMQTVKSILAASGEVITVPASKLPAATALCSCGIAYAYKFIQAGVQAGVEMGLTPEEAQRWFAKTLEGAAVMAQNTAEPPTRLIDAVTTPGGMTIKGVNSLERNGFVAAVIEAVLTPLKK